MLNQGFFPNLEVSKKPKKEEFYKLDKIIEIYCFVDDFYKAFKQEINNSTDLTQGGKIGDVI